jgi:Fe2+-dicitrate sensor, membrane component
MSDDASRQADRAARANTPDWDALARFLAGESSGEEAVRVQRWLEAHPTDKALIEQLSSDELLDESMDVDVEAALTRVHARMEQPEVRPRLTLERGNGEAPARLAIRRRTGALALLLATAAGIVAVVTLSRSSSERATTAVAARTYSTRTGQRDSIMLSDGSRVILGPDSRLIVSAGFGQRARAVELQGDGYFDVHHDPAAPFSVRVANALVEDIGTTFTIESDAGDTTSVSVLSGSVRLRANGAPVTTGATLAAGDRGSLTLDGQVRAYRKAVRSDDASWTTGRVVFHDASLTRIAGEIRRWYGVELHVADSSLLTQHVTTTFDDGDSIDQVLKSIALALGARVDRQGDSATIHSNRGSAMVR